MYKWIGVEFCLLNTVFEIGCHWYSKSYHKLKCIEMRTHFFPSGKKVFTDMAFLHEKSMT